MEGAERDSTHLQRELELPPEVVQVVELEALGRRGKALRAAAALATGRTSMPNVFIGGRSVGGFTDGFAQDNPPHGEHRRGVGKSGSTLRLLPRASDWQPSREPLCGEAVPE